MNGCPLDEATGEVGRKPATDDGEVGAVERLPAEICSSLQMG